MTTVHLRSWRVGLCAIMAAMLMTACGETPTAPSTSAPFSTEDLQVGTGLQAVTGSVVSVNYTLWLYQSGQPDNKGTLIETNFGRDPFSFTLGTGSVITGWDKGIPGMMEGGVRRLTIPPSLAYGQVRSGLIPPNSTLVFEVELLSVS